MTSGGQLMHGRSNEASAWIVQGQQATRFHGEYVTFTSIEEASSEGTELLLSIPFAQAATDGRPLSAVERTQSPTIHGIRIHESSVCDRGQLVQSLPHDPVTISDGGFDITDDDFQKMVSNVIDQEIGEGHGSNFVLHRTYRGKLAPCGPHTVESAYRNLLTSEKGAYWTFLVQFPGHCLLGASPELHLRGAGGTITMNPISGTYRYPAGGPYVESLMAFLSDPKERDELYMVVDEELKIMSEVCESRPWVEGPTLKRMSRLAHTEYYIHGRTRMPWSAALQRSLVAPTVLGSPLDSAFRMAARQDVSTRGHFGGVIAHVPADRGGDFDSAIMIRTARIESDGTLSLPVGSTIVRHSQPEQEVAETTAKAAGLLGAFSRPESDPIDVVASEVLERRSREVSAFWTQSSSVVPDVREQKQVLIVDHEDRFTRMLAAHRSALGLQVTVLTGSPSPQELATADLVVLGPGPGDPGDVADSRIVAARKLTAELLRAREVPVLAVCLSHQILCLELGLEVRRLARPNQGRQRTIDFFGQQVRVAFYNSFSAFANELTWPELKLAVDPDTGEVFGTRAPNLMSLQFHPESILSLDGAQVLRTAVDELIGLR
ncbi:anthranilate synthase family protein [Micromonospora sp. NPDC057141]|uniref:anthranilate synthase family protein n=1 Tax=Micromonospora sp. NPDC057141 TaxID=3346033 RepID=UPI00364436AE